jgi:hypothetical protein
LTTTPEEHAHDDRPPQPPDGARATADQARTRLHDLARRVATLTVLNLLLEDWLRTLPTVPRTFALATVAVPIVIYGVMPQLQRARGRLLSRRS